MQDGFVKVAACAPRIRVADVTYNVRACADAVRKAAGDGAKVVVLPELCITGSTCGDLFWQNALLDAAFAGVVDLAAELQDIDALVFVGAPLCVDGRLYDCAVALHAGEILGIVPKRYVPAAQSRHFVAGPEEATYVAFGDDGAVPFGAKVLFACSNLADLVVAAEVGEDLDAPVSMLAGHAFAGATLRGRARPRARGVKAV